MERANCEAWVDGEAAEWADIDDFLESVQDDRFHIGQIYEKTAAKTYRCLKCGGNQFYVGTGSCYTALKCPTCGWELCVHEG